MPEPTVRSAFLGLRRGEGTNSARLFIHTCVHPEKGIKVVAKSKVLQFVWLVISLISKIWLFAMQK